MIFGTCGLQVLLLFSFCELSDYGRRARQGTAGQGTAGRLRTGVNKTTCTCVQ